MSDWANGILARQQEIMRKEKEVDELVLTNAQNAITSNADKKLVIIHLKDGSLDARMKTLKHIIGEFKNMPCKVYAIIFVEGKKIYTVELLNEPLIAFPTDEYRKPLTMFVIDFRNNLTENSLLTEQYVNALL